MKLTGIKTFIINVPSSYYGGECYYFLQLDTDEGICGWGEFSFFGCYNSMKRSFFALLGEIFDTYLKGESPFQRERIWKTLYGCLCAHRPGHTNMAVISAIDIALWDICGKFCKLPVYELLGGKYRDRIRSYSYIYCKGLDRGGCWDVWRDPLRVAQCAYAMVEDGFTALKYDNLPEQNPIDSEPSFPPWVLTPDVLNTAEATLREIRAAIGTQADIIIGTHGQLTPAFSIMLAKRMEPYQPFWFEEPIPPENVEEMARVARATFIPIATGERLCTSFEFMRVLACGAAAILQPDVGCCGGITELKKIAAMAENYYVQIAPHVWGGPISTAASLQLAANIPNLVIQESIGKSGGFFDELLVEPIRWENGYFIVPDRPGIGVELSEKALKRYSSF